MWFNKKRINVNGLICYKNDILRVVRNTEVLMLDIVFIDGGARTYTFDTVRSLNRVYSEFEKALGV